MLHESISFTFRPNRVWIEASKPQNNMSQSPAAWADVGSCD